MKYYSYEWQSIEKLQWEEGKGCDDNGQDKKWWQKRETEKGGCTANCAKKEEEMVEEMPWKL